MREIKFRGKPINLNAVGTAKTTNGGWVYGYLSRGTIILPKNDLVPSSCTYAHPLHIAWPDNDVYINCNVDPCTVGQFTGLFDKNGREIYEGDIIKYHPEANAGIGRVIYIGSGFYVTDEFNGLLDSFAQMGIEVIGNIHDNPELLEGKRCDTNQ